MMDRLLCNFALILISEEFIDSFLETEDALIVKYKEAVKELADHVRLKEEYKNKLREE